LRNGEIEFNLTGLNVIYMYMFYDVEEEGELVVLNEENVEEAKKEFAMVIRDCVHHPIFMC